MQKINTVLSILGYEASPHFITEPSMAGPGVYSILRQLRPPDPTPDPTLTPTPDPDPIKFTIEGVFVYETDKTTDQLCQNIAVCVATAENSNALNAVRRMVWNTGAVPFLLVLSEGAVRLYQAFSYDKDAEALIDDASQALSKLIPIRADEIDTGRLWYSDLAKKLIPGKRVDQRLLGNLLQLRTLLRNRGIPSELIHKLIGKFIYFRYLKDRGILSDPFLIKRGLSQDDVFSAAITPASFQKFSDALEERFNGKLFEIDFKSENVSSATLCLFADVFKGHVDVTAKNDKAVVQLIMEFMNYDFQYIPVELLSKVYELFLHESGEGEEAAAFYTPEYLAEYVLNDLHAQRPAYPAMKVLDPACGSGIFLSLAYRRLIENMLRETGKNSLNPTELRTLLERTIFGVEKNREACEITAFSLILTLLHYVDPPALHRHENFQFPSLIGKNILNFDFFDPLVLDRFGSNRFDWIAGNPPWKRLSKNEQDGIVGKWIRDNQKSRPIPGIRIEYAFVWRALDLVDQNGVIGFVLPSAGLVNDKAVGFRTALFNQATMHKVTNLSHVRRLLFHGAILPPSVWIYGISADNDVPTGIKHFAPKSVHLPTLQGNSLWAITVSESDIHHVDRRDVEQGEAVPWKIAQWGCSQDPRILQYLDRQYPALLNFLIDRGFNANSLAEGPQFRTVEPGKSVPDDWEFMPNYRGVPRIDTKRFNGFNKQGIVFSMPSPATREMTKADCYLRKRGGKKGLAACRAPHLFIGASWGNAFVFSNEDFVIPSRQFGLAGRSEADIPLLKAVAIYLSSSLVKYWMFFNNPEMGESDSKNRVTLQHLKRIPTPRFTPRQIEELAALYDRFTADENGVLDRGDELKLNSSDRIDTEQRQAKIDREVARQLKLPTLLKVRIEDFTKFTVPLAEKPLRMDLFTKIPTKSQFNRYGKTLTDALDGFAEGEQYHSVSIKVSKDISCCNICFRKTAPSREDRVTVEPMGSEENIWIPLLKDRLSTQLAPAFYLQRNLRVYNPDSVQMFKASQEPDWSRTQAHADAGIIISEALRTDTPPC